MTQPTALFLADILEDAGKPVDIAEKCAAELRRQHEEITQICQAGPRQKPVAWIGYINGVANDLAFEPFDLDSDVKKPLFTAPPTLTDDQLDDIAVATRTGNLYDLRIAIERAQGVAVIVAAVEREECAKVCEEFYSIEGIAQECADSIRARSNA